MDGPQHPPNVKERPAREIEASVFSSAIHNMRVDDTITLEYEPWPRKQKTKLKRT